MRVDRVRPVANLVMVALFAYVTYESLQFQRSGRWFPLFTGVAGLLIALFVLFQVLTGRYSAEQSAYESPGDHAHGDDAAAATGERPTVVIIAALISFPLLLAVVGLMAAAAVWLAPFLRYVAETTWRFAVGAVLLTLAAIYLLDHFLGLALPGGVLLG